MQEEKLPEELVQEILRHSILPSPEVFLNPASDRASFHSIESPPSPLGRTKLLLVSKRWLRIGTPLMYKSIWLSSSSHTRTVANLFSSHQHLGESVVDLRLDGGFDEELYKLIMYAANIKNVYLAWNVRPTDSIKGLLKVLPSLSPETLYLGYHRFGIGARERSNELVALLGLCISEKWLSLKDIHLSYWYRLTRTTSRAIQRAPSLESLNVHAEDVYHWSWSTDLLCFLENCTLRNIICRSTLSPDQAKHRMAESGVRKRIVDSLTFVQCSVEYESDDFHLPD